MKMGVAIQRIGNTFWMAARRATLAVAKAILKCVCATTPSRHDDSVNHVLRKASR